jgi:hypothetical protein
VKKIARSSSQVLCSVIALTLSAVASAEFDYGLRAGASYSDNVERTPTDEQSSGAAAVGVDLRGTRTTGRLLYDVFADLEYRDYSETGIDSQEFGRFIADSSYAFVPETFEWMLSGSFDQVREELLRPIAPENLENVITLSTGPRATARFGETFEGQAEAHYTIADYSEREEDNETVGGLLTFGRRLSERSYLGVGASYDDVTYDTRPGFIPPDYERIEYFLRFNTEGSRTSFEADVGYAEVSGETVDEDAPVARVRLTRRVTPFVSAFVGYTSEFATSADASFTPEPSEGDLVEDASILTAGPRENESAEIGLNLARPRTTASLVYARRSETTLGGAATADRDFDEVFASFNRLITTRSSFGLYAAYTEEKIDAVGSVDSEETTLGAQLHLAFGRALGVELRVEHRERDSDLESGSYEELSGGIFLRYGSAPRLGQPQATP